VRFFSFGGGVQSTAVLALQALGRLPDPYDAFLFANVGDDSEDPLTIEYFHEYHKPFAKKHGIELHELHNTLRGKPITLVEDILRPTRSIIIPMYVGTAPGRRKCTGDYKIKVVHRWHRKLGSTSENPATVGLGISVDEIQRARTDSGFDDQLLDYPLLDLGMHRRDCFDVIEEVGLPKPPRSACFFCPFHSMESWRELKNERPALFAKAVEIEEAMGDRCDELGKGYKMWMTKFGAPLDRVVDDQMALDLEGPEGCDSGSCFT
jgi:hypothetical protein